MICRNITAATATALVITGCATNYENLSGHTPIGMDCIVGLFEPTVCYTSLYNDEKYGEFINGPGIVEQLIGPASSITANMVRKADKVQVNEGSSAWAATINEGNTTVTNQQTTEVQALSTSESASSAQSHPSSTPYKTKSHSYNK